jgi:hypothetical protein
MTTLDRLHRRDAGSIEAWPGVLLKPSLTRAQLSRRVQPRRCAWRSRATAPPVTPLLSFFVDVVGNRDRELLDELESLIGRVAPSSERKQP